MISSFRGLRVAPTVKLSDGKGIGTILRLRFLRNNFSNSNVLKTYNCDIFVALIESGYVSALCPGRALVTELTLVDITANWTLAFFSRFFTSSYKIQWKLQKGTLK